MQKKYKCITEEETERLAEMFADIAEPGDVFALNGTLGVGKSVFARAFIKKKTKAEEVPSPTFTLVQTYPADLCDIYHFDLYRLKCSDEVFELGFEDAVYGNISLIEWSEKAGEWLPRDIFDITISSDEGARYFTVKVLSEEKIKRLEKIQ